MAELLESPCVAACQELLAFLEPLNVLSSGRIETEAELQELWQIDKAAYGDCSLDFGRFLDWWRCYPYGSKVLFAQGRIVASIGVYPLHKEQAEAFMAGSIPESALVPVPVEECEAHPVHHWYCSGIVVVPELQNRGLLRSLLKLGLGSWQLSGHVGYPLKVLGLAEYNIGEKLLQKHGFVKHKNGAELPDHCDLYIAEFNSFDECLQLLKRRGY